MDFARNLHAERVFAAHPVEPLLVEHDMPLRDVFALLKAQRSSSVLVCRDGALAGIFTERDALRLMAAGDDLTRPIAAAMTPDPVTVAAESTVGDAIRIMSAGGYRRLPILDADGAPCGVLKVSGIVRYLAEHFPHAIYNLHPEPHAALQQREGA